MIVMMLVMATTVSNCYHRVKTKVMMTNSVLLKYDHC